CEGALRAGGEEVRRGGRREEGNGRGRRARQAARGRRDRGRGGLQGGGWPGGVRQEERGGQGVQGDRRQIHRQRVGPEGRGQVQEAERLRQVALSHSFR